MKCNKVRERLLTDYRDGELDRRECEKIDSHLRDCGACKKFQEEILKFAVVSPEGSGELRPGPEVWDRIRSAIFEEEPEAGWLTGVSERLRFLLKPAPLIRMAFAVALILVTVVMARVPGDMPEQRAMSDYLTEQAVFFSALGSGDSEFPDDDGGSGDLGFLDFV
ncbi:MAG: hypothetical protein BWY42_00347 [Candidatus Omnitrophica bacterium ADurb.Bin277]|nr:MAG: hypothetical protein BWY42_00347 [Candidatus Omnitrophica bacterium ADurb.Bin277]